MVACCYSSSLAVESGLTKQETSRPVDGEGVEVSDLAIVGRECWQSRAKSPIILGQSCWLWIGGAAGGDSNSLSVGCRESVEKARDYTLA